MWSCPCSLRYVWRARPCVIAARDERRRSGALAVRITPTPTCRLTTVQAGVCSLLDTAWHAPLAMVSRETQPTVPDKRRDDNSVPFRTAAIRLHRYTTSA